MTWRNALTDFQRTEVEFAQVYADKFDHGTAEHDRLTLIDRLTRLLDAGNVELPPPGDPDRTILQVPFHSQHEADAEWYRKDCGPACVEMVGKFYNPESTVSTNEIMAHITNGVDRSIYIAELQNAARDLFGLTLTRHDGVTWEQLKAWIGDGRPCIVLVHYGSFATRIDRAYTVGHYMVVTGFDFIAYQKQMIERAILHDPDFYRELLTQGAFIPVTQEHFMGMWEDCHKDRNPRCMALVAEGEKDLS